MGSDKDIKFCDLLYKVIIITIIIIIIIIIVIAIITSHTFYSIHSPTSWHNPHVKCIS